MSTTNQFGSQYPLVTADFSNNAVTYAKMQQASALKLLGNSTNSQANIAEITLGAGLAFSGTTLILTGGAGGVSLGQAHMVARGLF